MAKRKSTPSSTQSEPTTPTKQSTPLSSSTARTATDKIRLRLQCGHWLAVDSRPNPRKKWPDPQTCEDCKGKRRVVEIWGRKVDATNLTAPNAPKDYVKRITKIAKKTKASA